MPPLVSLAVSTPCSEIGAQKLGQPVPESNFVSELNRLVAAAYAAIDTFSFEVVVLAGERRFSALPSAEQHSLEISLFVLPPSPLL